MPNKDSVERLCYMLCETGRFSEADTYLRQATGKFITCQDASDIRDSLIEDYQGFRELM